MSKSQPSHVLLAVSLIVCTLALGARGEVVLYNGTGTIFPTLVYVIALPVPLNQSTAVRIVVEATPCNAEGTQCSPELPSLAETHLYCSRTIDLDGYDFISGTLA